MRFKDFRRLLNHTAVTTALRLLADDDGVFPDASTAKVAKLAGRSIELTATALRRLEDDGFFVRLDWRDGLDSQHFALCESPDAMAFVRRVRRQRRRSSAKGPGGNG